MNSRLLTGAAAVAAGLGVAIIWLQLWRSAGDAQSFFGGDLVAYLSAARRLVETGSPYSAEVMSGPVANIVQNVPIGYFYPPPLSQLFVPLVGLDRLVIAPAYVAIQVLGLAVLLPMLLAQNRRSALALTLIGAMVAWSYPMQLALFGGNVSAVFAITICIALIGNAATASTASVLATIIKMTPAPLLLVSLVSRKGRRYALATLAIGVSISFVISPRSWADWLTALPNVLRNDMNRGAANYSPASIGEALGFAAVGGAIGLALCVAFLLMGLRMAARQSNASLSVLAAAVGATTFASSTMWDHYFAVLIPLNIYGWDRARSPALKLCIFASAVVGLGQWIGFNGLVSYRIGVVFLVALNFWLLARVPVVPHESAAVAIHPLQSSVVRRAVQSVLGRRDYTQWIRRPVLPFHRRGKRLCRERPTWSSPNRRGCQP